MVPYLATHKVPNDIRRCPNMVRLGTYPMSGHHVISVNVRAEMPEAHVFQLSTLWKGRMVDQDKFPPTIARILQSNEGGPVRRILNGRRRGRTGGFVSFKAGMRAMPWESLEGELPMLQISEVSSGVSKLLAQPHRLEMQSQQLRRRLIYFPDLELSVDRLFLSQLREGRPFAEVAAAPRPRRFQNSQDQRVIIEVKTEGVPRADDEFYLEKLRLAHEVLFSNWGSFLCSAAAAGHTRELAETLPAISRQTVHNHYTPRCG